jgi:hypothetical protein
MDSVESCPSLESLLTHVFRQLETPLLTLDRIVDFLSRSDLTVPVEGDGIRPANSLSRRLILTILSNSDRFVLSGPPHAQTWALRLNNPYFQSDTAVAASIEQLLSKNGPATLDQILAEGDSPENLRDFYQKVLSLHSDEFSLLPDNRIWFKGAPVPARASFDTMQGAVEWALNVFAQGATIEELRRLLCVSISQGTPITRLAIAQELAARPNVYVQVQRGKYGLAGVGTGLESEAEARSHTESEAPRPAGFRGGDAEDEAQPFNPESFFGGGFSFAPG